LRYSACVLGRFFYYKIRERYRNLVALYSV
jgi:hypothetical protein